VRSLTCQTPMNSPRRVVAQPRLAPSGETARSPLPSGGTGCGGNTVRFGDGPRKRGWSFGTDDAWATRWEASASCTAKVAHRSGSHGGPRKGRRRKAVAPARHFGAGGTCRFGGRRSQEQSGGSAKAGVQRESPREQRATARWQHRVGATDSPVEKALRSPRECVPRNKTANDERVGALVTRSIPR
jgi:hypothetical protein